MSTEISFQVVTPSSLSYTDIEDIFELEQDMWSRKEGLGEYLKCLDCENIYSKNVIYDSRNKDHYYHTVAEIERLLGGELPKCNECHGSMEHCFTKTEGIKEILERYSEDAHLALMFREDKIIGFMDGYLGSFEKIYQQELSEHYENIGKNTVRLHIEEVLNGVLPEKLFTCCSMGTRESFMNMRYVYSMLQCFFVSFPKEYEQELGISELHQGGTLDRFYKSMGSKDIGMSRYKSMIKSSDSYNSGLFIQESLGQVYRQGFSKDLRTFLRERAI